MAFFSTFGRNDTMRPSDILDLAKKMILFNGISIFFNIKMLWWPNFGQNFCIFGLKWQFLTLFCPNAMKHPDILDLVIK